MANFTGSAIRNVITQKVKPALVFARDFYTAKVETMLFTFCVKLKLTIDGTIGLVMAFVLIFSD